jgi:hypothetical protein
MKLIGKKKRSKLPHERGLGWVSLVLKALVAQRVARKAHKGYKWTRRLPYLVAGGAVVAFVARKVAGGGKSPAEAGFTPPTPAPSVPSTPTPTGSPTAVTPAPTAAAPEAETPDADGAESKA